MKGFDKVKNTNKTSNDTIHSVMLACPFCGSEPILKKQGGYPKNGGRQQTYQVRCTKCELTDKFWSRDNPNDAVAVWNTRHEA